MFNAFIFLYLLPTFLYLYQVIAMSSHSIKKPWRWVVVRRFSQEITCFMHEKTNVCHFKLPNVRCETCSLTYTFDFCHIDQMNKYYTLRVRCYRPKGGSGTLPGTWGIVICSKFPYIQTRSTNLAVPSRPKGGRGALIGPGTGGIVTWRLQVSVVLRQVAGFPREFCQTSALCRPARVAEQVPGYQVHRQAQSFLHTTSSATPYQRAR